MDIERRKVLFRGVDEGADDEAAEGGVRIGVCIGITVGFLAVGSVFILPLGTEFGGVQDDRGLVDCVLESRDGALALGSNRTFIRMFDSISMRATVAGAHNNLFFRSEFARHGVERVSEGGACHRVRQSHALTNDASLLGRSMPPLYPRVHETLGCFQRETPPCRRRG